MPEVKFGANIEDLKSAVDQVKSSIDSIRSRLDGVAAAFGVAFSAEGIKSFIGSMAELGEKTQSIGARLGLSNAQVVQLSGIAKLTGTSIEDLSSEFERMALNIQKSTKDGTNPAAQALKVLGLNARELIGLPADQYFEKLASAVSKFNPSMNLTNAVMAAGGKGVANMLPTLLQGGEHFREFKAAVDQASEGLAAAVPGMADTHEKLTLLGISTQSLGARIFSSLKPAIDVVTTALTNWVQSLKADQIRNAVNSIGNATIEVGRNVALFAIDVSAAFAQLRQNLPEILGAAAAIAVATGQWAVAAALAAPAIMDAAQHLGLGLQKTASDADAAKTKINQTADAAKAAFNLQVPRSGTWDDYLQKMRQLGQAIGEATDKTNKLSAAAINMGAANAAKAAAEQYQMMIKAAVDGYNLLKQQDESQVALHKMNIDEETTVLLAALDNRWTREKAYFEMERALYAQGSAQYNAVLKQQEAAYDAYLKEHQSLTLNQVKQDVAQWQSLLSPIESAWNSQLRGLLAGTTSWATATKKIVGDLVIQVIEYFEKIAIEKAALGLTTLFGAGPQSLISGLLGGGGQAAQAAATTANTTALATLTAAVAALTAATTGLVAAENVQSAIDLAPHFASGAWQLPADMLAVVHKNEMIVPAGPAAAFRTSFSYPKFDLGAGGAAARGSGSLAGGGGQGSDLKRALSLHENTMREIVSSHHRSNAMLASQMDDMGRAMKKLTRSR